MTATLGYARVSTTAQDLDAQLTALTAAGVEADRIFTDKLSGSAKTARPGLTALLDYARAGDTVVVTAIDRLGRSVAEVTRTITELGEHRILLRTLREGIDTATPTGASRGRDHGHPRRTRTRPRPRTPCQLPASSSNEPPRLPTSPWRSSVNRWALRPSMFSRAGGSSSARSRGSSKCRRLDHDYERLAQTSEAMIKWAMIGLMVRRLAPPPGRKPWQKPAIAA